MMPKKKKNCLIKDNNQALNLSPRFGKYRVISRGKIKISLKYLLRFERKSDLTLKKIFLLYVRTIIEIFILAFCIIK